MFDYANSADDVKELLPAAARTASANGTGLDTSNYTGAILCLLDTALGSGTLPTLDVKLQTSATVGGTYTDITGAVVPQVTGAVGAGAVKVIIHAGQSLGFVRAVATIGGTTPSFACAMLLCALKRY